VNFNSSGPLGTHALRAETGRLFLLLVLLTLASLPASGASLSLAWDPPSGPGPSGYFVYYGSAAGDYKTKIDAGNATVLTISGLADGATYHFAATSYDAARSESGFSNDLSATVPGGPLTADFTVAATSGSAPLALNFVNTSIGNITSYTWRFGDGAESQAENPVHVYTVAGTYSISLTVTGPEGTATKTCAGCLTVARTAGSLHRAHAVNLDAIDDLRSRARQPGVSPVSPAFR